MIWYDGIFTNRAFLALFNGNGHTHLLILDPPPSTLACPPNQGSPSPINVPSWLSKQLVAILGLCFSNPSCRKVSRCTKGDVILGSRLEGDTERAVIRRREPAADNYWVGREWIPAEAWISVHWGKPPSLKTLNVPYYNITYSH
jgi:hypothetical protein